MQELARKTVEVVFFYAISFGNSKSCQSLMHWHYYDQLLLLLYLHLKIKQMTKVGVHPSRLPKQNKNFKRSFAIYSTISKALTKQEVPNVGFGTEKC